MDLGTIKNKLISKAYLSPLEFASDVRLTFSNAMTHNPPKNQVYKMANNLNKFFEVRWKSIEEKFLAHGFQPLQTQSCEDFKSTIQTPQLKRLKVTPMQDEPQLHKWIMMVEDRRKVANDLESVLEEIPIEIYNFMKQHCLDKHNSSEDEIEIDIDSLDDDVLFSLQELLDKYLKKQTVQAKGGYCEPKVLKELDSNKSILQCSKEFDDESNEDVDIEGLENKIPNYHQVEIRKDKNETDEDVDIEGF